MIKKYTLSEISSMYDNSSACASHATNVVAFVLNHNMRLMKPYKEELQDKINEIITEYHDTEENGIYSITDMDLVQKANKEINTYGELEVSLDLVIIDETKAFNGGLTTAEMIDLEWMITSSSSDEIRALLGITEDEEEDPEKPYDVTKPPEDDDRFGL